MYHFIYIHISLEIFNYLLGTPLLWRLLNYRKFRCGERMSVYYCLGETLKWFLAQGSFLSILLLFSFPTSKFLCCLFLTSSLSLTLFDFSAMKFSFPGNTHTVPFCHNLLCGNISAPKFSFSIPCSSPKISFLTSTFSEVVVCQISCHWKPVL